MDYGRYPAVSLRISISRQSGLDVDVIASNLRPPTWTLCILSLYRPPLIAQASAVYIVFHKNDPYLTAHNFGKC